jgi:PHP family Zn ribbon phosphoesterase
VTTHAESTGCESEIRLTPVPPGLRLFAADLHVHIGASSEGKPVKVTASRDLTFQNIAVECVQRKGLDLVGIVDCASPRVMRDMEALLDSGEMPPQPGGGFRYQDRVTLLPAAEVETRETAGGMSHHLGYFRDWAGLSAFSAELSKLATNSDLSSRADQEGRARPVGARADDAHEGHRRVR